jgi:hypothetical protein
MAFVVVVVVVVVAAAAAAAVVVVGCWCFPFLLTFETLPR